MLRLVENVDWENNKTVILIPRINWNQSSIADFSRFEKIVDLSELT